LSASGDDRIADICQAFRGFSAVIVAGTGKRAADVDRDVLQYSRDGLLELSWGWRRSKYTNKSAGVAVLVASPSRLDIRQLFSPPRHLAGRGGAVRLRGESGDFLLIVLYLPPRLSLPESAYKECVQQLMTWASSLASRVGRRCIPLLFADLNDGLGLQRQVDGSYQAEVSDVRVGRFNKGQEHLTARQLREYMEEHDSAALDIFFQSAPSYRGKDRTSTIDFVIGPRSALSLALRCRAAPKEGRQLQLIRTAEARHHLPIVLALSAKLDVGSCDRRPRIDRDKLMEAMRTGRGKPQFLEAVERRMQELPDEQWLHYLAQPSPDLCWQWL